jgi:hypothetical protein
MPMFKLPGLRPGILGRMLRPFPAVNTAPIVLRVTPNTSRRSGGGTVTIYGNNFRSGTDQAAPVVMFGEQAATSVVVVDSNTLTCVVPMGAETGTVNITVTQDTQSGTLYAAFTYYTAVVVSVEPSFGPFAGGSTVVITGYNFQLGSTVTFGGVPATDVVLIDNEHIHCVAPAHAAGFVDVVVTGP